MHEDFTSVRFAAEDFRAGETEVRSGDSAAMRL